MRGRSILGAISCLLTCLVLAGAAQTAPQSKRVALVIGNATYAVRPLANPARDAAAIAEALRKIGFDRVTLKTDLGLDAFRTALRDFSREARDADVALVYYAGHGLEQGGRNYLVPVDASLEQASDLALETMDLETVREQIAPARRLRLVILDACRNAPFRLAGSKRSVERGLARVEERTQELIAFAAKEGTTADDGEGGSNSPFTAALLKHLPTPGLDIQFVFRRVAGDVIAATGGRQEPSTYGRLFGDEIALVEKPAEAGPSGDPSAGALPSTAMSEAAQAWAAVQSSDNVAVLEAYRKQFGAANPFYDRLAASRIETLQSPRPGSDASAPSERPRAEPPSTEPATTEPVETDADRQRRAAEAARKAEEDQKRLAELQAQWARERAEREPASGGKLSLAELRKRYGNAAQEGSKWIVVKGKSPTDPGYYWRTPYSLTGAIASYSECKSLCLGDRLCRAYYWDGVTCFLHDTQAIDTIASGEGIIGFKQ